MPLMFRSFILASFWTGFFAYTRRWQTRVLRSSDSSGQCAPNGFALGCNWPWSSGVTTGAEEKELHDLSGSLWANRWCLAEKVVIPWRYWAIACSTGAVLKLKLLQATPGIVEDCMDMHGLGLAQIRQSLWQILNKWFSCTLKASKGEEFLFRDV